MKDTKEEKRIKKYIGMESVVKEKGQRDGGEDKGGKKQEEEERGRGICTGCGREE